MDFSRESVAEIIKDEDFVDWVCDHEGRFRFVVYQGMEAMNKDICELALSGRPYLCLKRAGYKTINSMIDDIDRREDFSKKRVGRKSADEIMLRLFLYTYENLKPEKRRAYLEKVKEMN